MIFATDIRWGRIPATWSARFKMRELHHRGVVTVRLVPTAENGADMFTKVLDNKTFAKHRRDVMNLPAK